VPIRTVRATPFALPYAPGRESRSAVYAVAATSSTAVLIELVSDSGTVGLAEAPVRPHVYGDSAASVVAAVEQFFAPALIGLDPADTEAISARLRPPYGPAGNLVCRAALDIAAHDLSARERGVATSALLGGRSRARMPLTWILALNDTSTLVDEALERAEAGYRGFKVKVGEDPVRDVELVRELRRQLGADALIYVDANDGYSLAEAAQVCGPFADAGVWAIEDPCPVTIPIEARADLAARIPIPVLGDNCCFTPTAVLAELRHGTLGVVSLKVARSGYRDGLFITRLAHEFGAAVVIGTQAETALGTAAAAQLYAAQPTICELTELSFFERMTGQIVADPPLVTDGSLAVLDGPGCGISVDPAELDRHRLAIPA
jgi:L-alanine-DL-glutamate epimerase-like enolase superfamily enzyme